MIFRIFIIIFFVKIYFFVWFVICIRIFIFIIIRVRFLKFSILKSNIKSFVIANFIAIFVSILIFIFIAFFFIITIFIIFVLSIFISIFEIFVWWNAIFLWKNRFLNFVFSIVVVWRLIQFVRFFFRFFSILKKNFEKFFRARHLSVKIFRERHDHSVWNKKTDIFHKIYYNWIQIYNYKFDVTYFFYFQAVSKKKWLKYFF